MSVVKKISSELEEAITLIPGEEGWWKSSSEEQFCYLANELLQKGFTEDEIEDILASAYWAVADCYGGS